MTTVAARSSSVVTRGVRPAAAKIATAVAACSSLVSTSTWPPAASHRGASAGRDGRRRGRPGRRRGRAGARGRAPRAAGARWHPSARTARWRRARDAAGAARRKGLEQVTLVHRTAEVAPRAAGRPPGRHRPRAARSPGGPRRSPPRSRPRRSEVDDHTGVRGDGHGLAHEQLGPSPRDEDARIHGDPHPGELDPADDDLNGVAGRRAARPSPPARRPTSRTRAAARLRPPRTRTRPPGAARRPRSDQPPPARRSRLVEGGRKAATSCSAPRGPSPSSMRRTTAEPMTTPSATALGLDRLLGR